MRAKRRQSLLLWMDAGWTLMGLVALVGGFLELGTDEWWIYAVLMALCGIGGSITTGFLVLVHAVQNQRAGVLVTTIGGGGGQGSSGATVGTNGGGGKAYTAGPDVVTYGGAGGASSIGGHS